ncbi:hypothetical protein B0O99DRAFT_3458 [Bisporella sp. PMI_857]|nr:hypothetical protein B0O99DRAFT_3458 [Bisporella sp. PMI_857]
MMSFERLSERLLALQESNAQLKELIDRLANIKFQPGSVPLDNDDDNVKTELLSEIHQISKEQDEDLTGLQATILGLRRKARSGSDEQEIAELDRGVERAIQELKQLDITARKAQITANEKLRIARKEERELLIHSYLQADTASRSSASSPAPGQRPRTPQTQMFSREDKIVNATSEVTMALRRTHEMMQGELSKSQYAHEELRKSTAALDQLGETYSTLDTMLSSTRNLLGTLLRSQKSDTWYLETAFWVLSITIGWLVFRRLIYGPAWWLVWLPVKIVFKAWVGVFTALGTAIGLVERSDVDIRVSSVIVGQTPSVENSARATIAGSDAPVIDVGGERKKDTDSSQGEDTLSDRVGKVIDGDQSGEQTKDEEESVDVERNPKKRMWEEEKEATKEAQRKKDEL